MHKTFERNEKFQPPPIGAFVDCLHPDHSPKYTAVSLLPGQRYVHRCPRCNGQSVIIGSPQPTM